jgi:hypothetical protein
MLRMGQVSNSAKTGIKTRSHQLALQFAAVAK